MSSKSDTPRPHLFLGGRPSEYTLVSNKSRVLFTKHLSSGLVLRSSRISTTKDRKRLALENLSINVFLLGTGVYSIKQLEQSTGWDVKSDLQARFAMFRYTFKRLAGILEIVTATQNDPEEGYQLIHNDIQEFDPPQIHLQSANASRLRKLYTKMTSQLIQAYEGLAMHPTDMAKEQILQHLLDESQAWLDSNLKTVSQKDVAYLPFLVAETFISRIRADMFLFKGSRHSHRALRELQKTERKIRAAAQQFLQNQSLYHISIVFPEHVLFYVSLYRSIHKEKKRVELSGEMKLTSSSAVEVWDDGLSKLRYFICGRDRADSVAGSQLFSLKTVADYQWYCQFINQPPENVIVGEKIKISFADIFQQLGHPKPSTARIKKAGIRTLLRSVLPSVKQRVQRELRREFQWKELVIATLDQVAQQPQTHKVKDAEFTMVPMVAGDFLMGALPSDRMAGYDEKPQRKVVIDHDFWIGKHPVTQKLYKAVTGDNPSEFKGDDLPVEKVSWTDAILFCNMLSEKQGLEKVYQTPPSLTLWTHWEHCNEFAQQISVNWSANGYRLPTEEEWEYCGRGKDKYIYAGSNDLDAVGWYRDNSGKRTHRVGLKKPNCFGLHDMSGNVWEWCWSLSNVPSHRIFRGGSWLYNAKNARLSRRYGDFPGNRVFTLGFRILRLKK